MRWKLRHRPKLSDDQFYEAFYAESGIPRELPAQLRSRCESILGVDLGALRPNDSLYQAEPEADLADVFYVI